MLILINSGVQNELILNAFNIKLRKPIELEKELFFNALNNSRSIKSNWKAPEELKNNFLVVDYPDNLFHTKANYQENFKALEEFTGKKYKIIYILYFLLCATDIFPDTSFLEYPKTIRIIDLNDFDSKKHDEIILDISIDNAIRKTITGKGLFDLENIRNQLELFNKLYVAKQYYDINYFYYIGELIFNYINTTSLMMRFTILTSIIEFFLVHKGSNTEQFKFKTSLITNKLRGEYLLQGRNLRGNFIPDYQDDIKKLDKIYDIRSRIIHGDLASINTRSKEFTSSFGGLQFFVACTLHTYIINPTFITFIKNNG